MEEASLPDEPGSSKSFRKELLYSTIGVGDIICCELYKTLYAQNQNRVHLWEWEKSSKTVNYHNLDEGNFCVYFSIKRGNARSAPSTPSPSHYSSLHLRPVSFPPEARVLPSSSALTYSFTNKIRSNSTHNGANNTWRKLTARHEKV